MSKSPIFRNCDDISPGDFEQHPVWVSCHLVDYDEPWYDDVDEEEFRALESGLPIDRDTVAYISATFHTAKGIELSGYIENWGEPTGRNSLLDYSPTLFGPAGNRISFWHGNTYEFGTDHLDQCMSQFREAVGGPLKEHFPLTCKIDSRIFGDEITTTFEGFASFTADEVISIYTE